MYCGKKYLLVFWAFFLFLCSSICHLSNWIRYKKKKSLDCGSLNIILTFRSHNSNYLNKIFYSYLRWLNKVKLNISAVPWVYMKPLDKWQPWFWQPVLLQVAGEPVSPAASRRVSEPRSRPWFIGPDHSHEVIRASFEGCNRDSSPVWTDFLILHTVSWSQCNYL